jgi:hypothetical protein
VPADLLGLHGIRRYECDDFRIAGVFDARQHRFLRDVAEGDNGVADFLPGRDSKRTLKRHGRNVPTIAGAIAARLRSVPGAVALVDE